MSSRCVSVSVPDDSGLIVAASAFHVDRLRQSRDREFHLHRCLRIGEDLNLPIRGLEPLRIDRGDMLAERDRHEDRLALCVGLGQLRPG